MYEVRKPSGELIQALETKKEAQDYAFYYFHDGDDDRSTDVILVFDPDNELIMQQGGTTIRDIVDRGAGKRRIR